jgi:hypothetical protein
MMAMAIAIAISILAIVLYQCLGSLQDSHDYSLIVSFGGIAIINAAIGDFFAEPDSEERRCFTSRS